MSLKLFVWHDVLQDYTSGIIFALAEDVEEARMAVLSQAADWQYDRLRSEMEAEPRVYDSLAAFFIYGGG